MQKLPLNVIIIAVLIVTNFLWSFFYFSQRQELLTKRVSIVNQENNVQIINFTRLFINDVLKAQGEVNFEKRLELENAVRALKDKEILAQWSKFINSKNEALAQTEVKDLLGLLVNKIKCQ
jgi:hypothetical protein